MAKDANQEDLAFLEQSPVLDKAALGTLSGKLESLRNLQDKISEVSDVLKELKKNEQKMSREDIPAFLLQFGISDLTMEDGVKVSIKEDIALNVPKTDPMKRKQVMDFLINHGAGGLIKDNLVVEDPSIAVMEQLDNEGVAYKRSQDVNTGSVKAFVRGMLGLKKNTIAELTVEEFPKAMNVYVYRETKIKGV